MSRLRGRGSTVKFTTTTTASRPQTEFNRLTTFACSLSPQFLLLICLICLASNFDRPTAVSIPPCLSCFLCPFTIQHFVRFMNYVLDSLVPWSHFLGALFYICLWHKKKSTLIAAYSTQMERNRVNIL